MKLIEIRIESFGKLNERTFSPDGGMNLFEGPNESGKSTIPAFLRFVFYGFPRRNTADAEERDRRLPWGTRRAAGALLFAQGGKRYLARRAFVLTGVGGREVPAEEISVIEADTGAAVDTGGKSIGEYFLGLPAELFDSTLCVRQSDVERVSAPSVGEALNGVLFSGETGFGAEGALQLLERERRDLLHLKGRGGRIPALEDRAAEIRETLASARRDAAALAAVRAEKERDRWEIADCEERWERADALFRSATLQRSVARWEERRRAEETAQKAREDLAAVRARYGAEAERPAPEEAEKTYRALRVLAQSEAEVLREHAEAERLRAVRPKHDEGISAIERAGGAKALYARVQSFNARARHGMICGALLLLAAACGAAALWCLPFGTEDRSLFRLIGAAISGGLLLAAAISWIVAGAARKKKRTVLKAVGSPEEKMLRARLAQYEEAAQTAGRDAALAACEEREKAAQIARDRARTEIGAAFAAMGEPLSPQSAEEAETALTGLVRRREAAREAIAAATLTYEKAASAATALAGGSDDGEEDGETLRRRLSELPRTEEIPETLRVARERIAKETETWRARLSEAERRESALAATAHDDLTALTAEHAAVASELAAARQRLAAVTMAMEALNEGTEELRRDVTPRLRREASALFAELTDGAYAGVSLAEDLSLSLDCTGGVLPLSRFSAGCRDAAYLSLRFALLRLLSEEPLPLILDETLARLDDDRARAALSVLNRRCGEGGQCLLFTCHAREAAMLPTAKRHRV